MPYDDVGGSSLNRDLWQGQWFGGEFLASHTFWDSHRLTLGAEYRRNYMQSMFNFDVSPRIDYATNRLTSNVYGLFAQDEWRVFDGLRATIGLRYDHYDSSGGSFNPRLGLVYDPLPGTTLKLLYGRAFRAPTIFESRYICCDGSWVSNPNLKPETVESYELVLEQALGNDLRLRLSPFYNRINDIITLESDPGDISIYRNQQGLVEAVGYEAELQGFYQGIEARLSHSYQESWNTATDSRLVNSPRNMIKLNLMAPLWDDKTSAGLEVYYVSQRLTGAQKTTNAYLIANLTLFSSRLWKGLEITGSIYNVFDTKYRDPVSGSFVVDSMAQDGRALRLKLSYDF